MKTHSRQRKRQVSRPTRGYQDHLFDSELEAAISIVLKDRVTPLGGHHHGQVELTIKYLGKDGATRWYVPDWQVVGHPKVLIEAKARVDARSRNHLKAAREQGYQIGIVFPNQRASELPLFPNAELSMGQWLDAHGIRYVTCPEQSLQLLNNLIFTDPSSEEAI
ncbi:MAG: hypothetical protein E6Q71_03100 [Pseudomonas sp.]|nr:MAG: hypothetical protein E6Q71_03100 [Pseudomonas sp.]